MANATQRIPLGSGWSRVAEANGREALALLDAYGAVEVAVAEGEPPHPTLAQGHVVTASFSRKLTGAEILWARGQGAAAVVTLLKPVGEDRQVQPASALDAVARATASTALVSAGNSMAAAQAADGRAQAAQRAAGLTPMDFGAVGDGVADDTEALRAAMLGSAVLNFGNRTYRTTAGISFTHPSAPAWFGENAKIIYDGPETLDTTVRVVVNKQDVHGIIEGIIFDGGLKARQAFDISAQVNVAWPEPSWPTVSITEVVGQRARTNDNTTGMVSGVVASGGWRRVTMTRTGARDIYLGPDVSFDSSRSACGLRTLSNGAFRPRSVHFRDVWVERVWNEGKPASDQEADGISIFQATGTGIPSGSDCIIDGYSYRHVGNRGVKLHSAARAIVNNVMAYVSSSVLPFSGQLRSPAIDCQQGGATVSNCDFFYDGVCPQFLINNYSQRDELARNGAITKGIKVYLAPGTPETMTLLYSSVISLTAPLAGDTSGVLSDVVVQGGRIKTVAWLGIIRDGRCNFAFSNIVADTVDGFVMLYGTTNDTAVELTLTGCHQTGAVVPLVFRPGGLDPDWVIERAACIGFSA